MLAPSKDEPEGLIGLLDCLQADEPLLHNKISTLG